MASLDLGPVVGPQGPAGKSAYASATEAGYTGTESEFNQDLQQVSEKTSKPATYKAGDIPIFDANGNLLSSGKSPQSFRPRKNLIDNPRFKVNQRGQTTYTTVDYATTVDRWKGYHANVQLNNDGITVTNNAGTSGYRFFQVLPGAYEEFTEQTYTFSVLTQDNNLRTISTGGTSVILDLGSGNTVVVSRNNSNMIWNIQFWLGGSQTINVRAVKLEIGEGQTLAYQDADGNWQLYDDYDYTADLLECKRYFRYIPIYYRLAVRAANIVYIEISTDLPMVATPTITAPTGLDFRNYDNSEKVVIVDGSATASDRGAVGTLRISFALSNSEGYCVGFLSENKWEYAALSAEL